MQTFGKWMGRLLVLILVLVPFIWLGPRERIEGVARAPDLPDASALDPWLAEREAAVPNLRADAAKQISWAGAVGTVTPISIVYLHGFSASRNEIAPVPANVAASLGANLFETRLSGHGRDGDAMAEPRAEAWLDDTAEAMAIGRAIGDAVIVIGVSTGGTLAVWAATDPAMAEQLAGVVMISPNFEVVNAAGALLEWPFARSWVPLIAGAERSFEPQTEDQAKHWTTAYPTVAAVTMGTLLRETRAVDVGGVDAPALFIYSQQDLVVKADATRAVAAKWGGSVTLEVQSPGPGIDSFNHVLAGDILSPANTAPATELIVGWIRDLP
jgi:pimeloyl-ACP methyl ester carboxylesterase